MLISKRAAGTTIPTTENEVRREEYKSQYDIEHPSKYPKPEDALLKSWLRGGKNAETAYKVYNEKTGLGFFDEYLDKIFDYYAKQSGSVFVSSRKEAEELVHYSPVS
jgi:hypothetical protein